MASWEEAVLVEDSEPSLANVLQFTATQWVTGGYIGTHWGSIRVIWPRVILGLY